MFPPSNLEESGTKVPLSAWNASVLSLDKADTRRRHVQVFPQNAFCSDDAVVNVKNSPCSPCKFPPNGCYFIASSPDQPYQNL